MTRGRWLALAAAALFALHNDFWLWDDARLVLGLPVGLTYHVVYSFGVAVALAVLVRVAWPRHLDDDEEDRT